MHDVVVEELREDRIRGHRDTGGYHGVLAWQRDRVDLEVLQGTLGRPEPRRGLLHLLFDRRGNRRQVIAAETASDLHELVEQRVHFRRQQAWFLASHLESHQVRGLPDWKDHEFLIEPDGRVTRRDDSEARARTRWKPSGLRLPEKADCSPDRVTDDPGFHDRFLLARAHGGAHKVVPRAGCVDAQFIRAGAKQAGGLEIAHQRAIRCVRCPHVEAEALHHLIKHDKALGQVDPRTRVVDQSRCRDGPGAGRGLPDDDRPLDRVFGRHEPREREPGAATDRDDGQDEPLVSAESGNDSAELFAQSARRRCDGSLRTPRGAPRLVLRRYSVIRICRDEVSGHSRE